MGGTPTHSTERPTASFVRICNLFFKLLGFIWGTILLSIAVDVLANSLSSFKSITIPVTANIQRMVDWAFQNPVSALLILIILALLSALTFLGSHFNEPLSNWQVKQYYLRWLIELTKTLSPDGLPPSKKGLSARLDDIFVPVEFYLNLPLADYPLTEEELSKERLFHEINSNKIWRFPFEEGDKATIADLWLKLARDRPAAIIQGFPGMGKSTLLVGLTLYMARRCLYRWDYIIEYTLEWLNTHGLSRFLQKYLQATHHSNKLGLTMLNSLKPPLLPILLNLRDYATERTKTPSISLWTYLEQALNQLNKPGLTSFLQKNLNSGSCLVMFDGLDEISKDMRPKIQEAIKSFIYKFRSPAEQATKFNRFLITSRIADYDQNAFPDPDYWHYTIAKLSLKQIDDLLKGCYCAHVRYHPRFLNKSEEAINNEATRLSELLKSAITYDPAVGELVRNPLLLTLLVTVVVEQGIVNLPKQKIELYKVVSHVLLKGQSINRGLPLLPITEEQTIQCLGQLAMKMQEEDTRLLHRDEVIHLLTQTIPTQGDSNEIEQKAEDFLEYIRERVGFFVKRTDDYFGFFHTTFQEYFAARYMLNEIKRNRAHGISELVSNACCCDKIWREPFLLAVAYQSSEDKVIANQIIERLLDNLHGADFEIREHILCLAFECLFEAKPSTFNRELTGKIAEQIVKIYDEALQTHQIEACHRIETVVRGWLQ